MLDIINLYFSVIVGKKYGCFYGDLSSQTSWHDCKRQHDHSNAQWSDQTKKRHCNNTETYQHVPTPGFLNTAVWSVALSFRLWCSIFTSSVTFAQEELHSCVQHLVRLSKQILLTQYCKYYDWWLLDCYLCCQTAMVLLGSGTRTT